MVSSYKSNMEGKNTSDEEKSSDEETKSILAEIEEKSANDTAESLFSWKAYDSEENDDFTTVNQNDGDEFMGSTELPMKKGSLSAHEYVKEEAEEDTSNEIIMTTQIDNSAYPLYTARLVDIDDISSSIIPSDQTHYVQETQNITVGDRGAPSLEFHSQVTQPLKNQVQKKEAHSVPMRQGTGKKRTSKPSNKAKTPYDTISKEKDHVEPGDTPPLKQRKRTFRNHTKRLATHETAFNTKKPHKSRLVQQSKTARKAVGSKALSAPKKVGYWQDNPADSELLLEALMRTENSEEDTVSTHMFSMLLCCFVNSR